MHGINIIFQTLHSVCRIAEVLVTLQQVGNVKYTGWTLQVPCSTNRLIITELQEQAKKMEDELCQWKDKVRCRREEFYELNYFNTMQLLALRRELGKLNLGSQVVSPDVLALLQSISSQVSPQIVSGAVCQVTDKRLAQLAGDVQCEEAEMEPVFDMPALDVEMSDHISSAAKPTELPKSDRNKQLPNLTEDDLNETQKEIMLNISSRLDCSKRLVLMAFEECPGEENGQYDYLQWCSENLDRDIGSDDEGSELSSDSEVSTEDESETEDRQFKYSSSMTHIIHMRGACFHDTHSIHSIELVSIYSETFASLLKVSQELHVLYIVNDVVQSWSSGGLSSAKGSMFRYKVTGAK